MDDFRIREATAADQPRLIPLINAAFSVEIFLQGPRTDEQRLTAAMEKGTILVAEDAEGRLLASVYTELRGEHGYAGMLAVDPDRQGLGLGQRMMQAAEEHFRRHGCDAVEITVLSARNCCPSTVDSDLSRRGRRNSVIPTRSRRGWNAIAS